MERKLSTFYRKFMPLPPHHKLLYILIFWIVKPLAQFLVKIIDGIEWVFKRFPSIPSRIDLFKLFGTQVQLQRFTLLYLWWFPYGGWSQGHTVKSTLCGLLYIVTTFAVITMHEFCHILVARSYGIKTPSVLLNPFGGMAEMEMGHMLVPARQEFYITIAGPLFNAVLFFILITFWDVPESIKDIQMFSWEGLKFSLIALNLVMFVFNFLPIFPMDGGRIFRSFLIGGLKLSYVKATQVTCWVACVLGPCLAIWSIATQRWVIALIMPLMCLLAVSEYGRVKRLVAEHNAEVERYNSTLNET